MNVNLQPEQPNNASRKEQIKTRDLEVQIASNMTKKCEELSAELKNFQDEAVEYEIDFASDYADILTEQKENEEKIIALNKEIGALEEKEKNGTITEEEKEVLQAKRGELASLVANSKKNDMDNLLAESQERKAELNEDLHFATFIGNITYAKGEKLAATKVKKPNFFRKLLGITKKQELRKEVGEKALEVSSNLLDQVGDLAPAQKVVKFIKK